MDGVRTVARPISPTVDAALLMAGNAAIDTAAELDGLSAVQLEALVPALTTTIARFESVRLAALRAADRLRVGDRAGMRSTADWVAAACGDTPGRARSDCELADRLAQRTVVADALATGSVSKVQAAALAGAESPTADEQRELLADAASMSVNELERRVAQFNLARDQAPQPVVASVTIAPSNRGVKAGVTLDSVGGELFTTAVDTAAQKLTFDSGTRLAQRRAAGLCAIARYFLENHERTTHRLGRPHVVVNVPLPVITHDDADGSGTLGSGAIIDASTARQLACDSSVSRLITGPASEPLDIGRTSRSIPTAMARQLIVEDQHCRWPGCQSPTWSCEGHHVVWWAGPFRGETKLTNLALLCWYHHHLVHKDLGWHLHLQAETRQLSVTYQGRHVGATNPPGRQRQPEPVPAPAPPPTEPDPPPGSQSELFDDAFLHGTPLLVDTATR
jgi:Domain of unknown function (DUF222)